MPGIVGILDPRGNPKNDQYLSGMLQSITRYDWYSNDTYISEDHCVAIGRADLNISNRGKQPIFNRGRDILLFFYGKIYDFGNALASTESHLANQTDPECLLSLYEKYGKDLFKELNGDFTLSIIDKRTQIAIIANDRYGLRPLYYALLRDHMLFGSEVKALLQFPSLPREVNTDAVADFFTYGYLLGNKTLIKNTFLLPPSSILIYSLTNGYWKIYSYWKLADQLNVTTKQSKQSAIEEINHCFQEAVKRRIAPNNSTTISLSGGLDSRAILAVLDCQNRSINSITSGMAGCIDRKIAPRIAKLCKCPNIFYEYDPNFLSKSLQYTELVVTLTDGMRGSPYNALTILGGEKCLKNNLKNVLYGHGGEIAKLNAAYNFSIDKRQLTSTSFDFGEYIFNKMRINFWHEVKSPRLFTKEFSNSMQERRSAFMESIINKIDPALPIEQKISYLFINEFFRKFSVLSIYVHRNYTDVHLPFMDNDFLKAVLQSPPSLRDNYQIHRYIFQRNCPALLTIPLSQTRVRLDATKAEKILVNLPYRFLKRIGFFANDKPEDYILKYSKKDVFGQILLDKRTLDRGILNRKYLEDILERYSSGKKNFIHLLSLLVMFELWQRLFIDGNSRDIVGALPEMTVEMSPRFHFK